MSDFELFLRLGFQHILEGYDHLLFLIGLVVVARGWREMLPVVTAFTVAHSTTLVLSALDVIALPPSFTESLIAASIVYVGVENVVRTERRARWVVAGAFGLIHGAGFSGHLTGLLKAAIGVGSIWKPLLGFNLGIEIGQLVVIGAVLPLLWLARRAGSERPLALGASRLIAAVGTALLVWRIWEIV